MAQSNFRSRVLLIGTLALSSLSATAAWAWPWDGPLPVDTGRAKVHCVQNIEAACGAGAGGCASNYEMTFSKTDCDLIGVREGQTAGMRDLRAPHDGDSAWAYCTFQHELNHAQDTDDVNQRGGQTEVSSYIQGRACFQMIYAKNCAPERNGFSWSDCNQIAGTRNRQRADQYINACAAGEHRSPLECIQGCKRSVRDDYACRSAFRLYSHNFH